MTAVVVLDTAEFGLVLSSLKDVCEERYTSDNVADCSPEIGALVTEMAGLRPGQPLCLRHIEVQCDAELAAHAGICR